MVDDTQGLQFAEALADETKKQFEGIGVGSDYLLKANGDIAEVGGILLGISGQDEETAGWEEVAKARDYLHGRLDDIGLDWEMNDDMEQRQWEDNLTRRSPPYAEIVTAEVTEEHIEKLQSF
ncbi:hypothetical protein [Halococcus sp. IIIV-5B]|uniref:hypothetical protein n=1 Tax=Halococcus sp. IIIV-5B TaxID=2321230 RepID=UPI000E70FCCC|nr:hypothetical protein [Halococcus sp. IIIV-5B]RJS96770.1 hypothetical protein D3261_18840 [Halococcus sp. IIIV-5B]